jgi:hypothetical protein
MYSQRRNRNYQSAGFINENQPMMGQGQILVKGPGGRVQLMAPEQNFFSNYNCNDIIYALRELVQLGDITDTQLDSVIKEVQLKSDKYESLSVKKFKYGNLDKMIEMQRATGGNAGETFNQLAGFGKPRFTLNQLSQAVLSEFQNSVNGDVLRMEKKQFTAYKERFIKITSRNLNSTKCPSEIIRLVLNKLFEKIEEDIELGEYEEAALDGKRRHRRKSHADGRKRRRSKRSKRSRKSKSKSDGKKRSKKSRSKKSRSKKSRSKKSRSKSDGKKRSKKSRSKRSRKSRSKSDGKRRRSKKSRSKSRKSRSKSDGKRRSRKSRSKKSKKSRSRRSKHMSAKKLLKLLRKL